MTVKELKGILNRLDDEKEILVEIDGIGAFPIYLIEENEEYEKGKYVIYT